MDPIRESKAFKAVTSQVTAAEARAAKLEKDLAKYKAAEEARAMKENEAAGEYSKNIESLTAKLSAMEQAVKDKDNQIVAKALESEFLTTIAPTVQSPKSRQYLMSEYMALEDRPDMGEWIAEASKSEDYAPFFSHAKTSTGVAAPRATAASNGTGNQTWASLKADLKDPAKATAAAQTITQRVNKEGSLPPDWESL